LSGVLDLEVQILRLPIVRGDNVAFTLGFGTRGAGYDLTGYTFKSQIRATPDSSGALAELTCAVVTPQVGDARGNVTFTLGPEYSALLPVGEFVWDVQVTDPLGFVETWVTGPAVIVGDVTRTVNIIDSGGVDIIDGGAP